MKILKKLKDYFTRDIIKIYETNLILNAKSNIERVSKLKNIDRLELAEFKVFSQWGEDGIVQYLINNIEIPNKTFIEFGVQSYVESNTRFLLINDNWSGLVIDASEDNINYIKKDEIYWRYDLTAVEKFITKENINDLIRDYTELEDVGLLSVDIDGNDYWILKAINVIKPRILICEYNSVFGSDSAISVPYKGDFERTREHYSNLYWGASLSALCNLTKEKGYDFIGSNSAGNNAFFVRNDLSQPFTKISPKIGYVESKFRESIEKNGELTFLSGIDRLKMLKDLEVIDTTSMKTIKLQNLLKNNV